MNILMHMCCAPCALYPTRTLKNKGMQITGLYFNPNIHPIEEFKKRETYVEKLANIENFNVLFYPDNNEDLWLKMGSDNENKCQMCYEIRLKKTFEIAIEQNFDAVTTSLLVSPYQKHDLIIEIGNKYAKHFNLPFYQEDFRVGYRDGQKMAKEYGLYCQRYCGCIISLRERMKEIINEVERK